MDPLSELLAPARLTEVVDVGANPIDGDPPYLGMLRAGLCRVTGFEPQSDEILCIGDGIATDILGAMGEGLDALFVSGGLAAEETGTVDGAGPDPALLAAFLAEARLAPKLAIACLR